MEINYLANLLKETDPTRDDSDSEDEKPKKNTTANLTPASVVSQVEKPTKQLEEKSTRKSKDIWDPDEVAESGAKIPDEIDSRPQPEFEMHYKQKVTTEDVFLQMGNKNPSSASCEYLVLNIQLPSTKLSDIVLDITKTFLDCRSPKFRLALPLPHPVDPDNSQAKWDKEKSKLEVTLRLNREYEEFNF